jgi:hypothetical protein
VWVRSGGGSCVSVAAVREQWGGELPPLCRCLSPSPPSSPLHFHTIDTRGMEPTTNAILLCHPCSEAPVGGWAPLGLELGGLGCASAAVASPSRPPLSPLLSPPSTPQPTRGRRPSGTAIFVFSVRFRSGITPSPPLPLSAVLCSRKGATAVVEGGEEEGEPPQSVGPRSHRTRAGITPPQQHTRLYTSRRHE